MSFYFRIFFLFPLIFCYSYQVKGDELLISQSDTRDSGYYQCRAINEAGMAQATIHLYITPSGIVGSNLSGY